MSALTPKLLALIVCQQFRKEPSTGRLSIIGILPKMAASCFPCVVSWNFNVYSVITNARGKRKIELRIVDVDDEAGTPVHSTKKGELFKNPLQEVGIMLTLDAPITFPHPGIYLVQLLVDDEKIGERRLEFMDTRGSENT